MSDFKENANAPTVENEKGGRQSALDYDWTLVPWKGLLPVVQVLMEGAKKYGRDNWRKITSEDNVAHLLAHAIGAQNTYQADRMAHLTHVVCRALFAIETQVAEEQAQADLDVDFLPYLEQGKFWFKEVDGVVTEYVEIKNVTERVHYRRYIIQSNAAIYNESSVTDFVAEWLPTHKVFPTETSFFQVYLHKKLRQFAFIPTGVRFDPLLKEMPLTGYVIDYEDYPNALAASQQTLIKSCDLFKHYDRSELSILPGTYVVVSRRPDEFLKITNISADLRSVTGRAFFVSEDLAQYWQTDIRRFIRTAKPLAAVDIEDSVPVVEAVGHNALHELQGRLVRSNRGARYYIVRNVRIMPEIGSSQISLVSADTDEVHLTVSFESLCHWLIN